MTRSNNKISAFLLNLALLAFLVRGVTPAGFMPGHSANNTYPMVICSASGPITINVPADKLPNSPSQPSHHHDNMPCPYAQGFAQGTLADHSELPAPVAAEPVLTHIEISLALNAPAKNYFSHGPPALPA